MARDRTYMRLISNRRWLTLRRQILTEHPLCQDCEARGCITAATEVHHIRPVETAFSTIEKESLMYDPTNLRALCHTCHVAAHTERGRSGRGVTRARSESRTAELIEKLYGEKQSSTNPPGGVF